MDGTRTTDDICGLPRFETSSKKKYARSRTMEIMVHPGSRDAENKLLASEWWTQVMRDNEMISYNDL